MDLALGGAIFIFDKQQEDHHGFFCDQIRRYSMSVFILTFNLDNLNRKHVKEYTR